MEDISHILDPLNDAQREAVTATGGNRLVLAGAGSGKTRVLVHRIAWLIQVEHLAPWSLLAVTFTNKAAREMRTRIEEILQQPIGGMWVGTFHGLAHRFLRAHWQDARLPQHFQILDSDDQLRLVKRLLKELQLDESRYPPRQVISFINAQKDEGRRPEHLDDGGDFFQRKLIEVYYEYQTICERSGLIDFAELLLKTHELLRDRPDICHHYQQRFAHVLVDEFQDTNAIQYAWLRLLAGDRDNLFLVGDDDQSIYGWRGARVENMQSFQRDYPNTQVVRLEQNYRSTGNILQAANALIANNPDRLGKNLWTSGSEGEPLQRYAAFNEVDEARFVVDRIRGYTVDEGYRRAECAILYRTTAQSRLFEEALIQTKIPYRVYGGLRFFERAEIKDAMAYLRLVANPDDDTAFERAVNNPPRGIGLRTLDSLREQARESRVSLWRAARDLTTAGILPPRAAGAVSQFLGLIDKHRTLARDLTLEALIRDLIAAAGLAEHFRKDKDGKGQDRIENLEQLEETARRFRHEMGWDFEVTVSDEVGTDSDVSSDGVTGQVENSDLDAFLALAALEAGDTQADDTEDAVQLMTLHSAKGLEFPIVFLVGVEEGLFPHSLSANDPHRLEEERRLCYVGMTRAMHQLFVSHAESRRFRGSEERPFPSRFLREIPPELVREVRAGGLSRSSAWGQASSPTSGARREGTTSGSASSPETGKGGGFHLGQGVRHPKFGEGVVLNSEGIGAAARIQVKFQGEGTKWLVLAYAKLEPLA
jgi:DNA helicase-2/ATP-dependent DNA helicase PcrA